jgi:hypothetical protein
MRYQQNGNRSSEAGTLRVLFAVALAAGLIFLIDLIVGALR